MEIRKAIFNDTNDILKLLMQVHNIHAKHRPDLFIPDRTKYTELELMELMSNPSTPIFVAVEKDAVLGYAFCVIQTRLHNNNMTDIQTLFIDDICVDETCRGQHVGEAIYNYVENYAREIGCYHITLNVWEFNTSARAFYEKLGLAPMETVMEKILK